MELEGQPPEPQAARGGNAPTPQDRVPITETDYARREREVMARMPVEQFLYSMKAAGRPGLHRWTFRPGARRRLDATYWTLQEGSRGLGRPECEGDTPWLLIDKRGRFRSSQFVRIAPPPDAERLLRDCLGRHGAPLEEDGDGANASARASWVDQDRNKPADHLHGQYCSDQTISASWQAFNADVRAQRERVGSIGPVVFPQLTACAIYRVARWFRCRNAAPIAIAIGKLGELLTGAEINPMAELAGGSALDTHRASSSVRELRRSVPLRCTLASL